MKTTSVILVCGLFLASLYPAKAQDNEPPQAAPSRFIDIETDSVMPKSAFSIRTDLRAFGGYEDTIYVSAGGRFGLGNGLEGGLRASFANKMSLTTGNGGTLRHGGNDFEALLKYRPAGMARIAGLVGVAFADTPAQSEAILTLGATAGHSLGERLDLFINPRVVFVEDNEIFGLGLGASARISEGLHVAAEYTPIVSGENTRSVATGARTKRNLYGVAVHYTPPGGRMDWSVGFTNSTGMTTGFGLTPVLGGTGAFYFAVALHR